MFRRFLVAEPDDTALPALLFELTPGGYRVGASPGEAEICLGGPAGSPAFGTFFLEQSGAAFFQVETDEVAALLDGKTLSTDFSYEITSDNNLVIGPFLLYVSDLPPPGMQPVLVDFQAAGDDAYRLRKPLAIPGGDVDRPRMRDIQTCVVYADRPVAGCDTGIVHKRPQSVALSAAAPDVSEQPASDDVNKRFVFPKMPEVAPADQPDVDRFIYRRIKPLFERLVDERTDARMSGAAGIRETATEILQSLISQHAQNLPAGLSESDAVTLCLAAFMDYGPIQPLLGDESVTEIMVNGPNDIFIEAKGKISKSHFSFFNEQELRRVVEKMVAITNRRIDEQQAYQDTRLEDGSRVNVIIRPLSLKGDSITIRKFPNKSLRIEDLIHFGAMSPQLADFLRQIIVHRANTVVSGGTGSGKTTLLNVLSNFIPPDERLVSIEDAAELRLAQPNTVSLEAKPKSTEGGKAITIRDLVINALRMRPDRIIVGECRGGEALDMLQAMNTGHEGSLTTLHANTPRDALNRIETMCLMAGMELPAKAIRSQVVSAINFIVQQSRMSDGSRKITSIQEIVGMEGEQVVMQEIFRFQRQGIDDNGRIVGAFVPTGVVPSFVQSLRENRVNFSLDVFSA